MSARHAALYLLAVLLLLPFYSGSTPAEEKKDAKKPAKKAETIPEIKKNTKAMLSACDLGKITCFDYITKPYIDKITTDPKELTPKARIGKVDAVTVWGNQYSVMGGYTYFYYDPCATTATTAQACGSTNARMKNPVSVVLKGTCPCCGPQYFSFTKN